MIDFKELKERGKTYFKANYWKCVLVSLIMTALVTGVSTSSVSSASNTTGGSQNISQTVSGGEIDPKVLAIVISIVLVIILVAVLISSIINIFAVNPLKVGLTNFFMANSDTEGNADLDTIKAGFGPSYMRNVKTLFFKDLYVFLWSLLLIVPGIIKSYAYTLVPYILNDEPDLLPKEVLEKSTAMMDGHKWEYFKFELSFIGWFFVSLFTLGIAEVLYVRPYVSSAKVEYYKALRDQF